MIKEVSIPDIGENITEGTVIDILVAEGELVKEEQGLIEFETDKAVVDIPSPFMGKISEILIAKGDTISIGKVIIKIETEVAAEVKKEKEESAPAAAIEKETAATKPKQEEREKKTATAPALVKTKAEPLKDIPIGTDSAPASPTVRRLARELGADINKVSGTGPGERITDEDVKAYVKRLVLSKGGEPSGVREFIPLPDLSKWGEIKREKMSRVRELIARGTGYAWSIIPHVTQFDQADITQLEEFRKTFNKRHKDDGIKLTVTSILMKVIAEAVSEFPRFNASIDDATNEIVYRKYCNIGIAADTDRGLLVPVIRDIKSKSIVELARELIDIAERTRSKKISPDELDGGTFTISNQGGIGGTNFTPIVLWPQVAILGVSRASMQQVYVGSEFVPRMIMPLSLSYDHRANDGADAARFMRWICEAIEQPLTLFVDK
ncbi:MAG: 2-oxo acid dehydrogenase subunit E2 [candidate division Zixibacteria bacterium]|nr:2-oxo acid dehydrogenase subunit E2 [candidate division Zixibacteria bacterium]